MGMGAEMMDDLMFESMHREDAIEQLMINESWMSVHGEIKIKDMTISHLKNAIKYLDENDFPFGLEFKELMQTELDSKTQFQDLSKENA